MTLTPPNEVFKTVKGVLVVNKSGWTKVPKIYFKTEKRAPLRVLYTRGITVHFKRICKIKKNEFVSQNREMKITRGYIIKRGILKKRGFIAVLNP